MLKISRSESFGNRARIDGAQRRVPTVATECNGTDVSPADTELHIGRCVDLVLIGRVIVKPSAAVGERLTGKVTFA